MIAPGTLFEEFGFHYYGPIDGHDLEALIPTLENLKNLKGPKFLHVITKKGQGYKLAEADPILYHGVAKFAPDEGIKSAKGPGKLTYTQVFGDWLCDMAKADPRLIGIALAGHQAFSSTILSIPPDMFPKRAVGSVIGLGGFMGGIGGMIMAKSTGLVLDATDGNYTLIFAACTTVYFLAVLAVHLLSPKLSPVRIESAATPA